MISFELCQVEMVKMLLAIVLWLFGSVESFKLNDDKNVYNILQPGDKVVLKAVADYWFKSCTLKNNLQQTICTTNLSGSLSVSTVSDCNGNYRYMGDGLNFICEIEIQNVQKKGIHFCFRLLIPI